MVIYRVLVALLASAWIETQSRAGAAWSGWVALLASAWIETFGFVAVQLRLQRRAPRERVD